MVDPLHEPSHYIFMALEPVTFIKPQLGKLRLREDIQPGAGELGSEPRTT